MRAIHDDAHPFQRHAAREGAFGIFDVTAERVFNADSLADCVSRGTDGFDIATENQVLDLVLDVVVELVTVGPEKFDAVVRSEEHTSELQSQSNLVCRLLLE